MDWDDYRIFTAVAHARSIRAAAAKLGVSHSTVSRRVNEFERQLGVRLFERLPEGYFPTEAGEEMLGVTCRLEEEFDGLERRIVGRDTRLSGKIRVTLPDAFAAKLLIKDLTAFVREHPVIELEVNASYEVMNLSKREADVALRITAKPPEHLVGRKLVTYATAAYATPAYLTAHQLTGNAPNAMWIGWNDPVPDPQWVKESPYPNLPARGCFNNPLLQLEAAKAGMGISMLPCFLGDSEPSLQRLPGSRPTPAHDVWLLTHPDLRHTARIKAFKSFITQAMEAHRALLEGKRPVKRASP